MPDTLDTEKGDQPLLEVLKTGYFHKQAGLVKAEVGRWCPSVSHQASELCSLASWLWGPTTTL